VVLDTVVVVVVAPVLTGTQPLCLLRRTHIAMSANETPSKRAKFLLSRLDTSSEEQENGSGTENEKPSKRAKSLLSRLDTSSEEQENRSGTPAAESQQGGSSGTENENQENDHAAKRKQANPFFANSYNPELSVDEFLSFSTQCMKAVLRMAPLIDAGSMAKSELIAMEQKDFYAGMPLKDALSSLKAQLTDVHPDERISTIFSTCGRDDENSEHTQLPADEYFERLLTHPEGVIDGWGETYNERRSTTTNETEHEMDWLDAREKRDYLDIRRHDEVLDSMAFHVNKSRISSLSAYIMTIKGTGKNLAAACELAMNRFKRFWYMTKKAWDNEGMTPQYMQQAIWECQAYLSTTQLCSFDLLRKVYDFAVWAMAYQTLNPFFMAGNAYWMSIYSLLQPTLLPPATGTKKMVVRVKMLPEIKGIHEITALEHPVLVQKPLRDCKSTFVECARQQGKTLVQKMFAGVFASVAQCVIGCKAHNMDRAVQTLAEVVSVFKNLRTDLDKKAFHKLNASTVIVNINPEGTPVVVQMHATSGNPNSERGKPINVMLMDEALVMLIEAVLASCVHFSKKEVQGMFTSTPSPNEGNDLERLLQKELKGFYKLKLPRACKTCMNHPAFRSECMHLTHTTPVHMDTRLPAIIEEIYRCNKRYYEQEIIGVPFFETKMAFPFYVTVSNFVMANAHIFRPRIKCLRFVAQFAKELRNCGIESPVTNSSTHIKQEDFTMVMGCVVQPEFALGVYEVQKALVADQPLTIRDLAQRIWENDKCRAAVQSVCNLISPERYNVVSGEAITHTLMEYCFGSDTKADIGSSAVAACTALISFTSKTLKPNVLSSLREGKPVVCAQGVKNPTFVNDTIFVSVDIPSQGNSALAILCAAHVDARHVTGIETKSIVPMCAMLAAGSWLGVAGNFGLMKTHLCKILVGVFTKFTNIKTVVIHVECNTSLTVSTELSAAMKNECAIFKKVPIVRFRNDAIEKRTSAMTTPNTNPGFGLWSSVQSFAAGYHYLRHYMQNYSFVYFGSLVSDSPGTDRWREQLKQIIRQLLITELKQSHSSFKSVTYASTFQQIQVFMPEINTSEGDLDDYMKTLNMLKKNMTDYFTYKQMEVAAQSTPAIAPTHRALANAISQ
jgi:hypothetical protein